MDIILSFVVFDSLLYDIDGILTVIHILRSYLYKHTYSSKLVIMNIIRCYCYYAEERKHNELRVHNSFFVATSS